MRARAHHAALRLCVSNSSSESLTRRSLANSSSGIWRWSGIPPRRSHISIALSVILNRFASSSAPPSRFTISDVSAIVGILGTACSALQEQSVPSDDLYRFQANDNDSEVGNRRGMAITDPDSIPVTALLKFRELMADMGWSEKTGIKNLYKEVGRPLGMGEKAIKMWFDRGYIPPAQIFNVANGFGIDAAWLAGTTHLTKEEATDPVGLYAREMDRVKDASRKRRA